MLLTSILVIILQWGGGLSKEKIIFYDNYILWESTKSILEDEPVKYMLIDRAEEAWYYVKDEFVASMKTSLPEDYYVYEMSWKAEGQKTVSLEMIKDSITINNWECQIFRKQETMAFTIGDFDTEGEYITTDFCFCEIPLLEKYLSNVEVKRYAPLWHDPEIQTNAPYLWLTKIITPNSKETLSLYEIKSIYEVADSTEILNKIHRIKEAPLVEPEVFNAMSKN